jgi:hypothetical protein
MNMVYCPFRAQCGIYHFITQRAASLALGWDICWFSTNIPTTLKSVARKV